MKPERWQKIDELFHAALAREGEGRSAFLREACGGDEGLRREVESLVGAHEREGSFIDSPAFVVTPEPTPDDQAESPVGQRVGRYEVLSLLGRGGMGEVYLARDARLGRLVALKLLPISLTPDKERLGRFEQEARAASSLNHPNVCTIYEVGEAEDGRHYIAMEYIEGHSLRERLIGRPLKLAEVLEVGAQIASALAAAHAAGVIHRDIKPENILLRHDRLVKVVDFGLAKLVEQKQQMPDSQAPTRAQVKTRTGVVMGTVSYMSPEQARGLAVDARTDAWSLGCVLYETAAGRTPFTGATNSDILVSILEREPAPVARFAVDVPSELERIISKALRKDREERYQSTKELALDLQSLKEELEFSAKLNRSSRPDASAPVIREKGGEQLQPRAAEEAGPQPNDVPSGRARESRPGSTADVSPWSAESRGPIRPGRRGFALTLSALALVVLAFTLYMFVVRRGPAPQFRTLAVLPFKPLAANDRDESLELGMADTLIAKLSGVREVAVRPVTAVRRYSGLEQDAVAAGRDLGVEAVVDGSLQRAGERIRVRVRLLSVPEGKQLWAGQFDEQFTDVFALQDQVAEKMAGALALKLTSEERERLMKHYTDNTEAYELYLKGHYQLSKRVVPEEEVKKAVQYFEQALAKDPDYALAYAGLADSYRALAFPSVGLLTPREALTKSEGAAHKALEIDDALAEAHLSLAGVKHWQWDWEGAEKGYKMAIELSPNSARAHINYGYLLASSGRHTEAIKEAKRALEIDPADPVNLNQLGYRLCNARRYDESIEQFKQVLEMDANRPFTHQGLCWAYEGKGLYAEAIAACQKAKELSGGNYEPVASLATVYAAAGQRGEAERILKELVELSRRRYVSAYQIAIVYARLGEKEEALSWLEKGYRDQDSWMVWVRVDDPMWDGLRSEQRFQDLVRRIGPAK